jgi:hypothetical protein
MSAGFFEPTLPNGPLYVLPSANANEVNCVIAIINSLLSGFLHN